MAAERARVLVFAGCFAVLGLLWLGARLGARWREASQRRLGRRHNERGQAGERRAEQLLRAAGYRVCARKVTRSYALTVDGRHEQVQLIADLLVERAGERWVAEVKTGRHAPRLGYAETRRQMLEYQLAFEVPGVLLVDPDAARIREVRFPVLSGPPEPARTTWLAKLLVAIALLALLGGMMRKFGAL